MSSSSVSRGSTALKSTPVKKVAAIDKKGPPVEDSPGNWRHPRLQEITRRQGRTVFSEKNVKTIVYNVVALVILVVSRQIVKAYAPKALFAGPWGSYYSWGLVTLQAIPLINIGIALLPLVRRKDDLSDIPLTPGQRKLLGLPPSSVPPTPNSVYSTPPRYSRTPSIAGSAASKRSFSDSPISNNGSPASDRRLSGSPFSPAAASPLFQKAINGANGGRKSSFGSPSPLGGGNATSFFGDGANTPSPTSGKRSSVALNNKWLYERGRRTSGINL